MDEENPEAHSSQDQAFDATEVTAFVSDRDWFLQDIIRLANVGLGMSVTVIADGAVVSGTLIGGKQYFDQLASNMRNATYEGDNNEVAIALADAWEKHGLVYIKPDDSDDSWNPPEPGFLHMSDARIYTPGQAGMPENSGLLWRGKLNAISGFSMGKFERAN